MEVVDVLFLITVSVYPCQRFIAAFVSIQIQALPFVCAAFLNHLQSVPQEGGAVAWLAVTVQPVFFNPPAEDIVAVAFSMVQLFDTHFGQAVFGIVMVILGTAGGLFAAGTSVFVVAVFQSAEAEQLIKADQVLIAFFFAASSIQQVSRSIVLQGFPVSLVSAAFNSAGVIIAVIGLAVFAVFFAYQLVEVVVLVAAFDEDIRQNGGLIALYLFALQPAVTVVFDGCSGVPECIILRDAGCRGRTRSIAKISSSFI